MNYKDYFSKTTLNMGSSMIRELVASTKNIQGLISFAGGFPSPKTFPKEELSKIYAEVVAEEGTDVLQYGQSEGDSILKKEFFRWEGYSDLQDDDALITVGATNGIYYFSRALLNPGDAIFCEAPSFLGSIVAFEAVGADIRCVSLDEEGLNLDELKAGIMQLKAEGKKAKFIYTIPDFQNPAGVTMSLARRKALLELCAAEGIVILEDNPYARLRFSGEALPSLYRLAKGMGLDIVMEIISFSKILGPGMRLAYAKGNKELIAKMGSWQQKVNVSPDCVTERVVARYMQKGLLNPHIESICDFYRPYLHSMLEALQKYMPESVSWTRPEGGIFIWLWLPEQINADEMFHKASQAKVSYIPGSKFYPKGQEKFNCLRLNFSFSSFEQIDSGIKSLAEIIRSYEA